MTMAKRIHAERNAKKTPVPRPKRLSIDICTTCGSKMEFVTGPIQEIVNGESFWIPDVAHHNCARCGNKLFSIQVCQTMFEQASSLYRQRHHLLTGAEILAIRKQLKLTQVQLAALLKLGGNTLSRWESGRIVQSAAMDTLLRLLRDVPGTLPYLRKRARAAA
jgi:putative zinc finger/helix-turn-helix YgiT family protein